VESARSSSRRSNHSLSGLPVTADGVHEIVGSNEIQIDDSGLGLEKEFIPIEIRLSLISTRHLALRLHIVS
jgi:hypothetical protein